MRVAGVSAIPTEAVPKQTTIGGQPHMLAYINPQEAQLLQDRGGIGSLFGIPTFYNPADDMLYMTADGAQLDVADIHLYSNGFKCRANENEFNGNCKIYIYMAWAEFPFKTTRAF